MQKKWGMIMRIDIDFDSKKTAFVQGIALLMMLSLHLFHYPQWIDCSQVWYGIFINKNIEHITGEFGVLCINIFCFLSGYGWNIKYNERNFTVKHIIKIYIGYWLCLISTIIIIGVLKAKPILSVNMKVNYLFEFLGFTQNISFFSWYVIFYVVAIILFPIVSRYINDIKKLLIGIIISFILHIAIWKMSNNIYINSTIYLILNKTTLYFPTILVGAFFQKKNYMNKMMKSKSKWLSTKTAIVFILVTYGGYVACNYFLHQQKIALFLFTGITPFFIVSLLEIGNLIDIQIIRNLIIWIGKNSLFFWLLQAIIFYTNIQKVFYLPRYSIFVLIWTIIVLSPMVILLNCIYKYINKMLYIFEKHCQY